MLAILARRAEVDRNWLLVDLPAESRAAHLTGTLTGLRGDAAIIDPGAATPPYVLVAIVRHDDDGAAERALSRASVDIYRAIAGR